MYLWESVLGLPLVVLAAWSQRPPKPPPDPFLGPFSPLTRILYSSHLEMNHLLHYAALILFWIVDFLSFSFFFCFSGPYLWHMQVPRLGVESELQLPATATATATLGLSHICDLHHSSWQRRVLNPPREPRGRTHILMGTSRVHYH